MLSSPGNVRGTFLVRESESIAGMTIHPPTLLLRTCFVFILYH